MSGAGSSATPAAGAPRAERRTSTVVALLGGLLLGAGACAGPPWYLGAPLDGKPAIPAHSRAMTVAQHRLAAEQARAERRRLLELEQLMALDARESLRPDERRRLVELLVLRTRDWSALRRPIPLAADLRHVLTLAPERAHSLGSRLRAAEIAAGDAWLAIGENARAEDEYRRAERLGDDRMDFRFRAAWGANVTDLDLATVERAMSELPERVLAPFAAEYLDRAPAPKPRLVLRAWSAARRYGPAGLLARLEALPIAERFRAEAAAQVAAREARRAGGDGAVGPAAAPGTQPIVPPGVQPGSPAGGAAADDPALGPAPDDFLDAGPTLARSLIPAARAFPHILDPSPRSHAWAEHLVDEDPRAPDSLEVAAVIEVRAGRYGGAARRLGELVFFSGDRAAGYERAARVWQDAGRTREECAAWNHATRLGALDDPRWCELLACVKRDPGAGDAEAIAAHIRERAPRLPCAVGTPVTPAERATGDATDQVPEGDRSAAPLPRSEPPGERPASADPGGALP